MTINDFQLISFGVCFKEKDEQFHFKIPIDDSVRKSLIEMRDNFCKSYDDLEEDVQDFSPTEKYGSNEKLKANLSEPYLESINNLYHHQNAPINDINLGEYLPDVEFYFAEFVHVNGSKTIGVKRPNQFKALLKKKIVRFYEDTLRSVEDNIFKLDLDFDFLIHDTYIEILHPAGFIFISDLENQIFEGIANVTNALNQTLSFINFNIIGNFITNKNSRRGAKLLTSIKSRNDLHLTCRCKLTEKCQALRIPLMEDENGCFFTDEDKVIDLLEVLDRRSYEYDLTTEGGLEIYTASSRKKKN